LVPHVPERLMAGHAGCLRAQRRSGRALRRVAGALRRVAGARVTPARPRRRRADESHLTGESQDVLKAPGGAALMLSGAKARLPPRPNAELCADHLIWHLPPATLPSLIRQTAQVLEGYGRMMVTAVGLNSAQGQILGSLSGGDRPDPSDGLRRAPLADTFQTCSAVLSRPAHQCLTDLHSYGGACPPLREVLQGCAVALLPPDGRA
jgi:hypothetical protein